MFHVICLSLEPKGANLLPAPFFLSAFCPSFYPFLTPFQAYFTYIVETTHKDYALMYWRQREYDPAGLAARFWRTSFRWQF